MTPPAVLDLLLRVLTQRLTDDIRALEVATRLPADVPYPRRACPAAGTSSAPAVARWSGRTGSGSP